jgi:hypothetical protein
MMKLEIYKKNNLELTFKSIKDFNKKYANIEFNEELGLSENDVLWADKDNEKNDTKQMLVVSAMIFPGSFLVSLPELEPVSNMRKFEPGEVFKLVASFKQEENAS